MRNVLKWLVVMLLVILPVAVLAQTQEDFDLSCSFKTSANADIYNAVYTKDEKGVQTAEYTLLTTLPEGTYIRLTGQRDEEQGLRECWYYADGAACKAWIDASAVETATLLIYLDDGSTIRITESLLQDADALADYFAERYPGREYGLTPPPTPTPAPTATPAPIVPDAWVSAEASAMAEDDVGVKLMQLGLTESTVMDTTFAEFTVTTDQLTFAENVDASHRVAVIYAPRSGSAALRDKAASNGKKLEACATGRIVPVLEYGKDFTLVRYEGKKGWVLTDALLFFPGGETPLGQGTLHLKGKTDGKDTVVIRTTASTSSAKVAGWKTGTIVTVLKQQGVWYAVEFEGWYGYVHQQYLTMEGE